MPANCTDFLQPLDLSPFKDHIKSKFVEWYASEVTKQLEAGVPLANVKVNMSMSNVEGISANWILSALTTSQRTQTFVIVLNPPHQIILSPECYISLNIIPVKISSFTLCTCKARPVDKL